jgi:aspartyl-tRNA(Asn)/glutamyl-tRNA(Gln) amidotransferase subunit B
MSEPAIESIALKVGMEVHVELATRTKMFSRAPNLAHPDHHAAEPNSLIDPVVLGLPGALPVLNERAIEMSILVGLALNCSIAPRTKWDRKSYFYPDLPKAYQISQYDMPLCFDGAIDVPLMDEKGQLVESDTPARIGIIRAHLEEDAGKLLHEAPGGHAIEGSIADWNRAGVPLLEIVTQPDFTSADRVVSFARQLRNVCRFLGVTEGVMQRGHMRFEPNINCILTLDSGKTVATPIVEVKNLNSFKALRGAIEHELAEQPRRWLADRREMGRGTKITRGWDDAKNETFIQREKEDAHDYRYFPDPDLLPVTVGEAWLGSLRSRLPELPLARQARYRDDYELSAKEAAALAEERETNDLYEGAIREAGSLGMDAPRAGRLAANLILQSGLKRANERSRDAGRDVGVHELGITTPHIARIAILREAGSLSAAGADELFGILCDPSLAGADAESIARERGLLLIRDDSAMERWADQAIAENPGPAADVRAGKAQAIGRIIGSATKLAQGKADAKALREIIRKKLSS